MPGRQQWDEMIHGLPEVATSGADRQVDRSEVGSAVDATPRLVRGVTAHSVSWQKFFMKLCTSLDDIQQILNGCIDYSGT